MEGAIIWGLITCVLFIWGVSTYIKENKKDEEQRRILQEEERRKNELEKLKVEDPESYYSTCLSEELEQHIFIDVLIGGYSCTASVDCVISNGILGCNCELPSKDDVERVKEVYYLKNGERREKLWSERDFPKVYEGYLYAICLRSIAFLFHISENESFNSVLFNGHVQDYAPATGHLEDRIIMSVLVKRDQFEAIDVEHVDPKVCFKSFKGVSAAKLYDVTPVVPVLNLEKEDHRFIESRDVSVGAGTNLAAMDWEDFEQLVRDLFQQEFGKNGGEVKVTQASRDGGVDAVIFDPDPLRGGKIIVQAKRYTNTVPVSAVRDLYGTVINEGANTGILITTSDYGSDSYEFAKDKPLKLLNGGHLLGLLEKNGREAYIDIVEAKKLLAD